VRDAKQERSDAEWIEFVMQIERIVESFVNIAVDEKRRMDHLMVQLVNGTRDSPRLLAWRLHQQVVSSEAGMESTIKLVRWIRDKDLWLEHCRQWLARRLLNKMSSQETERMVLGWIGAECGVSSTVSMQEMMQGTGPFKRSAWPELPLKEARVHPMIE
jgi:hypothetical protein